LVISKEKVVQTAAGNIFTVASKSEFLNLASRIQLDPNVYSQTSVAR